VMPDLQAQPFNDRATSFLNYLAAGHSQHNWTPNTLSSYGSAILDLFPAYENVQDLWSHILFFKAVNDSEIRSLYTQHINIPPIIGHLQQLGDDTNLSLFELYHQVVLASWRLRVHAAFRHFPQPHTLRIRSLEWWRGYIVLV
jgi:hypothetical protein